MGSRCLLQCDMRAWQSTSLWPQWDNKSLQGQSTAQYDSALTNKDYAE